MSAAGGSAAAQAALLRAGARRGVWRRVLAWLGVGAAVRRADAQAARYEHGAEGERETARLLAPLQAAGWHVRHDLRLRGRQFNIDHVLVSPCGTALVVLDTKNWHRGQTTALVGGRVHCGTDDRHDQVEKVAKYAALIAAAVPLPDSAVWPLVVVNLFALRSTDPARLRTHHDPVGPHNPHFVRQAVRQAGLVVAAWGAGGIYGNRGPDMAAALHTAGVPLKALRMTSTGQPGHPLYVPADSPLVDYVPA